MDLSDDGLVAALDLGNRRVNVFSPDGTLVREIRLGAGPEAGTRVWAGRHPMGR